MRMRYAAAVLAALALAVPASPSSAAPEDCLDRDPRYVHICVVQDAGYTVLDLLLGENWDKVQDFVSCRVGSSCR